MSTGVSSITRPTSRAIAAVTICTALLTAIAVAASPASSRPLAEATAARALSFHERATLGITRSSGSNLEAQGQSSGTLSGLLSLHSVVTSAEQMSASFVGRSRSGTLSGKGVSKYRVSGSNLYYTGTVSITHGTGAYAHASGSGIRIEGVMNRQRRTITMTISGGMHV
jgi:hypothetical protein